MALFTVTDDDGNEIEVSQSDLPDGATYAPPGDDPEGYISEERHNAEIDEAKENAVQDRLSNHVRVEEAANDQRVIDQVLEEHGEDIDLDAKKKEWRQEWEESDLQPAQEKLQTRTERMKELALLTKAREHGVEEQWVEDPKMRQVFLSDAKDRVEFDPEHGDDFGLVGLDESGDKLSGGKDRAYGGVDTLFSTMKDEDDKQSYFSDPEPQSGGGASPGGGGAPNREWSELSKEERAQRLNEPSTSIPTG